MHTGLGAFTCSLAAYIIWVWFLYCLVSAFSLEVCLPPGGSTSLVLDAELVAIDRADGNRLKAFQELSTRARGQIAAHQASLRCTATLPPKSAMLCCTASLPTPHRDVPALHAASIEN